MALGVETKHPDFTAGRQFEFDLIHDALCGETDIKDKGEKYLPQPGGFSAMPDKGVAAYKAYKMRAQFPEYLEPAVNSMLGMIHSEEIEVELPSRMEYLREAAGSPDMPAVTLQSIYKGITRALLTTGRYGLLADAPQSGGEPYLVGYSGDLVINWDADFYVVDESDHYRDGYQWEFEHRYRVFEMLDGVYQQRLITGKSESASQEVVEVASLDRLPFSVANAIEVKDKMCAPPLIGIARAALANYQLSADQRHQLYMSGQETLVVVNSDKPTAVGAGVVHEISGTNDAKAEMYYVSPTCAGIEAHGNAMEKNENLAAIAGARMFQVQSHAQESGEARKLRMAAETATILSIAQAGAALLERGLRDCAAFLGANEDEVNVTAPRDLMDRTITPQDAKALYDIYAGDGMSFDSYFRLLQSGGLVGPDREADDEYQEIFADPFGEITPPTAEPGVNDPPQT